ncbi:MAG: aminodeoxychorismate lyase [Gammaproteobacteria bacterium]|nr:aminodeoxychorismate lyase [Gammaproteobacteria bacterium]MDH5727761.1 aminodeoxychorismate lyase [Gammaproteobacteria bacterium]
MKILINGKENSDISVNDRGLQFGDGVFTTLTVKNQQAMLWPQHLQRLQHDCSVLAIALPQQNLLEQDISKIIQTNGDGIVKIIITRGPSERGYAASQAGPTSRIIKWSPRPDWPTDYFEKGIECTWCQTLLCENPRLAGVKHLNRLQNVLARMELDGTSNAEGLILNTQGQIIEAISANVFFYKENTLYTPDLSLAGVNGLMRAQVLQYATDQAVSVDIRPLHRAFVESAEAAFITNTVIGLWPLAKLGPHVYDKANSLFLKGLQSYLSQWTLY